MGERPVGPGGAIALASQRLTGGAATAPVVASDPAPERAGRKVSYVWGLDLVRFAAAVMVVFFHLSWKLPDPTLSFAAGWIGVEIFFVISGFVIMGSAAGSTVERFAEKRFARLYPAAIACAVINLAVLLPFAELATRYGLVVSATPGAFIASLLLIKGPFVVGALWTLPIELGFYAIIALLIWRGWIGRPVLIAAVLIAWSSLYLVPFCLGQYGILPFPVRSLGYGLLNLSMLRHGCFFGVGILLWVMARPGAGRAAGAILGLGLALCAVEIVARVAELRWLYAYPVDPRTLLIAAIGTFFAAVIAIRVFSRLNEALRPGHAAQAVMRSLGLMTYPLYLMHEGVGGVTFSLLLASGWGQGVALLAGLAAALGASWVVVVALEPWIAPRLTAMVRRIAGRARILIRAGNPA